MAHTNGLPPAQASYSFTIDTEATLAAADAKATERLDAFYGDIEYRIVRREATTGLEVRAAGGDGLMLTVAVQYESVGMEP